MIQKKICMLGTPGVGKSSLVRRFLDSIFSEEYLSTIGVKVDKKVVQCGDSKVTLVLWDVEGLESVDAPIPIYLRGMAAYLLVVDPTRPETLSAALKLKQNIDEHLGKLPYLLALNKADLKSDWQLDEATVIALGADAIATIETSAKEGTAVDECFQRLANELVGLPRAPV